MIPKLRDLRKTRVVIDTQVSGEVNKLKNTKVTPKKVFRICLCLLWQEKYGTLVNRPLKPRLP